MRASTFSDMGKHMQVTIMNTRRKKKKSYLLAQAGRRGHRRVGERARVQAGVAGREWAWHESPCRVVRVFLTQ